MALEYKKNAILSEYGSGQLLSTVKKKCSKIKKNCHCYQLSHDSHGIETVILGSLTNKHHCGQHAICAVLM